MICSKPGSTLSLDFTPIWMGSAIRRGMFERVSRNPKPRPRFFEPMECKRVHKLPESDSWVYEPKQDIFCEPFCPTIHQDIRYLICRLIVALPRQGVGRMRRHRLFRVGEMSTGRIEAFSDGVFAIVMTLLILEIHVPTVTGENLSTALGKSLLALMPKFLSYILSFGIVSIWWVAHHHFFDVLQKSDRGLLWFNNLFLLCLASVPFPTALMGDYPAARIAVMTYASVMALAGLSFSWMRYYAFFIARLAHTNLDRQLMKGAMLKSVLNPLLHVLAILVAFASTRAAIGLLVIIP